MGYKKTKRGGGRQEVGEGRQVETGGGGVSEGGAEKHKGEVSVNWLSPSDLSQPINSVGWNTHTHTHTQTHIPIECIRACADSLNRERWRLRKWSEDEGGREGENEKERGNCFRR